MIVLDNFYPQSLIDPIVLNSFSYEWQFGRSDTNNDLYWTIPVYGNHYVLEKNKIVSKYYLDCFKYKEVEKCWDFFKSKMGCGLSDDNLITAYFNGITYGVEAHAHVDSFKENYTTAIIYVCENWNSHWGGETVFFDGKFVNNPADDIFYSHDIIKSVLPKYNRVLLFDSRIIHSVRPLSKSFKNLRKTLMFKIKNKNVEEFKNYAT